MSKTNFWQSALALILLSLVMRPPLTSVGALLPEIRDSLDLVAWQVSLIAALPVLLFGFGAFFSPALVRIFGVNRSIFILTAVLAAAIALRATGDFGLFALGTFAIGFAIAVNNVLLPSFVRNEFSSSIPMATGAYAAIFGLSASAAAALAVPMSLWLGSWRLSLLFWAVIAMIAAISWAPFARKQHRAHFTGLDDFSAERRAVIRSNLGWAIIAFFALQSAGFYLVLNWLPSILRDFGFTAIESGNLLALTTFIGVPFSLIASYFFTRMKSLAWLAVGVSLTTAFGYVALLVSKDLALLGCVLVGLGQATTFPMALSFISTRAANHVQTTQLSTLAQGIGYLIAAVFTFAVGALRDEFSSWLPGLAIILIATLIQTVAGYVAGKPGRISSAL
ncbi:MAG: hypothetical protein RL174_160 [Actinomycetota bacterium]|jgi:CP family cyanate transporter-like MFS transporter